MELRFDQPAPWIALAVGLLLGWAMLAWLRRQDHDTWVFARAPRLPIRALAVGDDAWLRGIARCASPLTCPWFGVSVVAFDYTREREHVWTTRDKDGKTTTHREWRTERHEQEAVGFVLDDGSGGIPVGSADCDNEAMQALKTDYERSDLRHRASVIEVGAELSVLGVKQDDGSFGAQREVPCLLTRQPPDERVRSAGRGESVTFGLACWLPALAGGVAAALVQQPFAPSPAAFALVAGTAVATVLPFWGVGTWNRLVRLRHQVLAAFRQVDVDLAVRAALVPNLVAVVTRAAGHEQGLLRDLAAIRSGRGAGAAAAAEDASSAAVRAVLVLHERFPELTTDALYRDLHERLWACEEKLAHSRQFYNDIVREWNDRLQQFPSSLVARVARCRTAPFFADDHAPLPPPLRQEQGA